MLGAIPVVTAQTPPAAGLRAFSRDEHAVWGALFGQLDRCRRDLAHPIFTEGLEALGIDGGQVPDLAAVNRRLLARTGWRGVPVRGLEDGRSFFAMLRERLFPVGNFIRDARDLGYTPAPDVFHDLYGHLPLLADPDYADFCWRFGLSAGRCATSPETLVAYERLFWFGVEFPLIETEAGRRIFGGGILSSSTESDYALSPAPEVLPFDVATIAEEDYRIDIVQPRLFVLKDPAELYGCLPGFEAVLSG